MEGLVVPARRHRHELHRGLLHRAPVGRPHPSSFKTHLGPNAFKLFGDTFAPMLQGVAVLLALWLILFWMYRRKIFLRI